LHPAVRTVPPWLSASAADAVFGRAADP